MTNDAPDLLPPGILQEQRIDRKKLIPLWIRIFSWIFLVMGIIAPFSIVWAALGYDFSLSLYDMESNSPFNLMGVSLVLLFVLKGIVAFGLINLKDWAVQLAIVDAVAGIVVCVFTMGYALFAGGDFNLRLELLVLVPYLIKMQRVKEDWQINSKKQDQYN